MSSAIEELVSITDLESFRYLAQLPLKKMLPELVHLSSTGELADWSITPHKSLDDGWGLTITIRTPLSIDLVDMIFTLELVDG